MMALQPDLLGRQLCAALGLPDDEVMSITLVTRAGEMPVVTVEICVWDQDLSEFVTQLATYELRPSIPVED